MKTSDLKKRLQKKRPMTMISLRMPEDVVDDLKRVAPLLGFSGYQPLMRSYIGQGLRNDLEKLDKDIELETFIARLKEKGVEDEIISSAIAETQESYETEKKE